MKVFLRWFEEEPVPMRIEVSEEKLKELKEFLDGKRERVELCRYDTTYIILTKDPDETAIIEAV